MSRAKSPTHKVHFRRRREGKTNYEKRLGLVKSRKTRFVVRRSNKSFTLQFVNFAEAGDLTLLTVTSNSLKKVCGWNPRANSSTAYLSGFYAAHLAKKKKISDVIFDMGRQHATKGSVFFAVLKGAKDGGLELPVPEDYVRIQVSDDDKKAFEEAKKKLSG